MKNNLKVYLKYMKMQLLSGLEYKGWWLMCLQVLFVCLTDPLPTLLMFHRMGGIGVWSAERVILIYSMAVTSFGLAESFCRGFDYFPWKMLQSGDFDRLLLRPRSLALQVAGSVFHIHRVSRAAAGLCVIIWMLSRLGVTMTLFNTAVLVLALAGGALMYCGVFVLTSGIAFFTIKALDWIYIFTNASYQVTRIPVPYMPRLMHRVFTFLMPILLIGYYPASVICAWGEAAWTGLLALPAGLLFLGAALLVWRVGVRHYKSTGS
jgi:ABC-2 type transport system permease protein